MQGKPSALRGGVLLLWTFPMGIFFFKQKTAYEIASCLVGSEMCIRDSLVRECTSETNDVFAVAVSSENPYTRTRIVM